MADIVLGLACSRSPLTAVPPEYWGVLGERDATPGRKMRTRTGAPITYEELKARVDPAVVKEVNLETFQRKYAAVQKALDTLQAKLAEVDPDVVVWMGDDEEEYIHEDNRPAIM